MKYKSNNTNMKNTKARRTGVKFLKSTEDQLWTGKSWLFQDLDLVRKQKEKLDFEQRPSSVMRCHEYIHSFIGLRIESISWSPLPLAHHHFQYVHRCQTVGQTKLQQKRSSNNTASWRRNTKHCVRKSPSRSPGRSDPGVLTNRSTGNSAGAATGRGQGAKKKGRLKGKQNWSDVYVSKWSEMIANHRKS